MVVNEALTQSHMPMLKVGPLCNPKSNVQNNIGITSGCGSQTGTCMKPTPFNSVVFATYPFPCDYDIVIASLLATKN